MNSHEGGLDSGKTSRILLRPTHPVVFADCPRRNGPPWHVNPRFRSVVSRQRCDMCSSFVFSQALDNNTSASQFYELRDLSGDRDEALLSVASNVSDVGQQTCGACADSSSWSNR